MKRLIKNRRLSKGMDIKLAKNNIRKQVGGSLSTSNLSMGRALAPTIGKTLGLSALAGLASEGAIQLVKKISGGNIFTDVVDFGRKLEKTITGGQVGGFLIPQNKINQLIAYKNLLFAKQKQDILNAPQTGSGVRIKSTKTQLGNGFGTILASIGFVYNLESSYMSGSHWVSTYVKDGVINYFDSFGMPPFQMLIMPEARI